jgi:hypothetical protein
VDVIGRGYVVEFETSVTHRETARWGQVKALFE